MLPCTCHSLLCTTYDYGSSIGKVAAPLRCYAIYIRLRCTTIIRLISTDGYRRIIISYGQHNKSETHRQDHSGHFEKFSAISNPMLSLPRHLRYHNKIMLVPWIFKFSNSLAVLMLGLSNRTMNKTCLW